MSEVRTVRRGNTRYFYLGNREVACCIYQGEREAMVSATEAKMLGIPASVCFDARDLKEDEKSTRTFLEGEARQEGSGGG
jgi:hypothetical protein